MENRQGNGNYEVQIWYNGGVAFFKREASELFENSDKQTNILVYIDEDKFEDTKNFDMALAVNLARNIGNFKVGISTDYNAGLAEKADVVINRFESKNQKFLEDLARYDDGSRLFVSDEVNSRNTFRSFVGRMKSYLASDNYVRQINGDVAEIKLEVVA